MELILLLLLLFSISFYRRYAPVKGVECVPEDHLSEPDHQVIDLREYNDPTTRSQTSFQHIPYAYLKRFYKEIPHKEIHVIASDEVDLKLGIRFLKSKGFQVKKMTLLAPAKSGVYKLKKCGGY
ncbi:sulfurtransferase [Jeotgalibacillus aurantiacus]|uniref:sulfurtransferase n=1 Tax=Jeotgalibacillus aurantiacus TaxID=2763266 RepID=UPI001D09F4CB|nr:sulfurtransferase [Jeotgalibacillus aurantiacus]